jgi:hypothetical protein
MEHRNPDWSMWGHRQAEVQKRKHTNDRAKMERKRDQTRTRAGSVVHPDGGAENRIRWDGGLLTTRLRPVIDRSHRCTTGASHLDVNQKRPVSYSLISGFEMKK